MGNMNVRVQPEVTLEIIHYLVFHRIDYQPQRSIKA